MIEYVSRLHLPCVRAVYAQDAADMTPSFISSQLTFMNIDDKYCVATKDPFDILKKTDYEVMVYC